MVTRADHFEDQVLINDSDEQGRERSGVSRANVVVGTGVM